MREASATKPSRANADHRRQVRALRPHCFPGTVGECRQGEQGNGRLEHQRAHRAQRLELTALGQRLVEKVDDNADPDQPAQRRREMLGARIGEGQDAPRRPMRRQRRRGQPQNQQHGHQATAEFGQQIVDRRRRLARDQELADQPHRQDGHQHQPYAVDRGGDGAVALAGLDILAAAPATAQHQHPPPQHDGGGRPPGERREILITGAERPQAVLAPHRHGLRDDLHRRRGLGHQPAPHRGREGRDVAMQQRPHRDFATQLGHALQQLVGAGDDDLALLGAAFADRGLLGQPFALGLHRRGLGRLVGAGLHLEGRQQLLGVGKVVARQSGGGRGRGTHVGRLLAQSVDLGRQDIGLVGPVGDTVELARPQVDQLGKRPLRRRHGLGERCPADQQKRQKRQTKQPPHPP
jgi:hypothetical protein